MNQKLGRITSVRTSNGMCLVSVQLMHSGGNLRHVPLGKAAAGAVVTPEKGWIVAVDYLEDNTPYVAEILSSPDFSVPDLDEGEFTFRFDDETHITVTKDGSGNYDVHIDASGDITIGDSGSSATLVTDVQTTTDGSGNVTSVTPVKTTKTQAE